MPKLKELIPTCLGDVEDGDTTCDGDPDATRRSDRAPCAWRARCLGFQLHLAHTGERATDRIQLVKLTGQVKRRSGLDETAVPIGLTYAQFARFCKNALAAYGHRRPTEAVARKVAPPAPARCDSVGVRRPPAPKPRKRRTAEERAEIKKARRRAFRHGRAVYLDRLRDETGLRIQLRSTSLLLPGDVRVETDWPKFQCTLYVRTKHGRDKPLTRLRYMPASDGFHVWVATTVRSFDRVTSRITRSKLNPEPCARRQLPLIVRGAKREGLSLIAEAIGRLLDQGIIPLPDLQGARGGV